MNEITEKGQTVKSTILLSPTASGMLSESEALSKDTHERSGRANEEQFVFLLLSCLCLEVNPDILYLLPDSLFYGSVCLFSVVGPVCDLSILARLYEPAVGNHCSVLFTPLS